MTRLCVDVKGAVALGNGDAGHGAVFLLQSDTLGFGHHVDAGLFTFSERIFTCPGPLEPSARMWVVLLGVLDAKVGGGEFVTHALQPFHQFRRAFAQVTDTVGVHVVQRAALGDHVQNVVVHLVDGLHLGGHHAGFRAVEARGGQKAAAAHNRLLFHQNDVRASLRGRQRGGKARDAAAHDHHVGGHVLKLHDGSALHRALEGLGVAARLA